MEKVPNISYEEQRKIEKKLITPMGEESDNESDKEDGNIPDP